MEILLKIEEFADNEYELRGQRGEMHDGQMSRPYAQ